MGRRDRQGPGALTISRASARPATRPAPDRASAARCERVKPRRLLHLSLREYLPLLATIALWAVILVAIGHADTARLFAATVTLRAIQMLTRMTTARSIKRAHRRAEARCAARRGAWRGWSSSACWRPIPARRWRWSVALDAIGQRRVALVPAAGRGRHAGARAALFGRAHQFALFPAGAVGRRAGDGAARLGGGAWRGRHGAGVRDARMGRLCASSASGPRPRTCRRARSTTRSPLPKSRATPR